MPDIPMPPCATPGDPGSSQGDHNGETSIRLLLDAVVRRLNRQPLEVAERAMRHDRERRRSDPA